MTKQQNINEKGLSNATGPIPVTLTNDMLFHRVMELSNNALKGLVCALKGLDPKKVMEVELTNPIDYSSYAGKEIILDVRVKLDDAELLDIELQLYVGKDWEKRSLYYLCRTFDSIGEGERYRLLKPTTFIGIQNKSLFPDEPEFYSKYQLLNVKTHKPYSTLISLNVLYLNQIDLATDEDVERGLVYWAKLFNATTWEDLRELETCKPEFEEVASVMYKSNMTVEERSLYEAHQKFLMYQRSLYDDGYYTAKEEDEAELAAVKEENERLKALLAEAGIKA